MIRSLEQLTWVLVNVMTEVLYSGTLFVRAVASRSAPDKLERQQHQHEDDQRTTHPLIVPAVCDMAGQPLYPAGWD